MLLRAWSEGEQNTLKNRRRIAQSPLPLDEALPIAEQIADALEGAHEMGVIGRDLNAANIKVRPDGNGEGALGVTPGSTRVNE